MEVGGYNETFTDNSAKSSIKVFLISTLLPSKLLAMSFGLEELIKFPGK